MPELILVDTASSQIKLAEREFMASHCFHAGSLAMRAAQA